MRIEAILGLHYLDPMLTVVKNISSYARPANIE
jgi:hypothetical protein